MKDKIEEKCLYLCRGAYWPSKDDADRGTNQLAWKDLDEYPWSAMKVKIYRPNELDLEG